MSIKKDLFEELENGKKIEKYTLKNKNDMVLEVIPYGCRIVKLITKDKNGILGDVVLGHNSIEEYSTGYQGSFVGRYGNRIHNAEFKIGDEVYTLTKNDGNNSLHGGPGGLHNVIFDVESMSDGDEPSITFAHTSPDGTEGFPGNLAVTVTYKLTNENELVISYGAKTDKETIYNPTNHSYFNLSGDCSKDVLGTYMFIDADKITAISDDLIPTGELADLSGSPLDFRIAKKLGDDMFSKEHSIELCGGFDHNYCLNGVGFRKVAEAYEPESGRVMEVLTDLPGVQLYTFNTVSGQKNKDGSDMQPRTAFCLETQCYPDSPNRPDFPFKTLKPGETFSSKTVYKFSVK